MPNDDPKRDYLIALESQIVKHARDNCLIALNLGCGRKQYEGWTNIDLYAEPLPGQIFLKVNIIDPPYQENTVDRIISSHSLEHLRIVDAQKALKNWHRILKPQGQMLLSVPNLDVILAELLKKNIYDSVWNWFLRTLYGYQQSSETGIKDMDQPDDPGQHHRCGWTNEMFLRDLQRVGFKILEHDICDGWGTPNQWALCEK